MTTTMNRFSIDDEVLRGVRNSTNGCVTLQKYPATDSCLYHVTVA
jgi:hypothetical protein